MSRRVVQNTKGATVDVDTAPEVQGGWRKPIAGEVGIHARGICGVHRETCIINFRLFLAYFFLSKNSKKFTILNLQMLNGVLLYIILPEKY